MDSSYDLLIYFPLNYADQSLADYVAYHTQHLDLSLEHGIESGVFFHTHILYMTFVYIQILRIAEIKDRDFKYSWILSGQENDFLKIMSAQKSPFAFSILNEKTVFRFFRLLNFDDGTIGTISNCIKERNNFAHANGQSIQDLDKKLEGYISNMEKITNNSEDLLQEIYHKFIDDNTSLSEVGYDIQDYDIEGSFLKVYYISEVELKRIFIAQQSPTGKVSEWIKEKYDL